MDPYWLLVGGLIFIGSARSLLRTIQLSTTLRTMDQDSERARFVDEHWAKLVQRVQMVMKIADELWSAGMLQPELYNKIKAEKTNQEKMRELYEVLNSGGNKVKSAFYSCLEKNEPLLLRDLGSTGHGKSTEISPVIDEYKKWIRSDYLCVTEYNSLPGERVLLSKRFVHPLILRKHRDRIEREEEIRSSGERFQQVLRSRSSGGSLQLNSLFDPDEDGISPRSVILQGNSGYGKSFTVQKIMMDWASGVLYKERFDIVFHLKCKEINRVSDEMNLVEILSCSCSLTSHEISQILQQSPEKVLVVIDGFDELKLPQDINNDTSAHTDLLQKARPVDTLCALLRRRILLKSFLLVSSRSTATDTLSKLLNGHQRFSEIVGFSEKGVEEYFQKFFQNEERFRKAYTYVKANETLITACSIPVVCWIICTTIQERFKDGADKTSGLETTSIYVDFVCTLLKHHCQGLSQSVPTLLRSLGQLAERGMREQQVLLDEKSVIETISDPTGNPFLCKILFKRRVRLETMFSFMHLSFQEFFTALYYVLLDGEKSLRKLLMDCSSKPHFAAVMQFAFGLLNKDQDVRLALEEHGLLIRPETQDHLKEWILEKVKDGFLDLGGEFILHCLYELHEEDFVKEVMGSWERMDLGMCFLSRADVCALLYCCQCCQRIEGISLFLTSEDLSMILPELHKFKKVSVSIEDPSDSDLIELINALTRGQTLSSQRVREKRNLQSRQDISLLSINKEPSSICIEFFLYGSPDMRSCSLTFPLSSINIDWTRLYQIIHQRDFNAFLSVLHSFSNLEKMKMWVKCLNEKWFVQILQMSQKCPSLTELKVDACLFQEDAIEILKSSNTRPGCVITFSGRTIRDGRCDHRVEILLNDQGFSMTQTPFFGTKGTALQHM
ncbi:NACHT, LRR and PYD domains-containing protein 1 homolog [Pimephales promelas]|uniref:NACHT, LRR and PYD domains-containing protein 1 homolog n=1 Tax=Pimephales promelas TaxID=90988 RepID=UPI001955D6FA|nr:NACHT, LRR and PYD domains-containing protein 1 homolog [Pimephales promelas]XP_039514542.1 NACHT, LRR and PYD domains-containing protein 1 homolog [Pimephales promelas]XP_039514543.1 NACHT, LRR and PYD domains-containing protein 1 homolog [Pimephales promelas]